MARDMVEWVKGPVTVIGKEGSTVDGAGFVQRLWAEANTDFMQVAALAKRGEDGQFSGFWGAMSDLGRSFRPWEDGFTRGLYLAGVECREDAQPPEGWVRWDIPGYRYLRVKCDSDSVFPETIAYLQERGITLAGAVHDFTCPSTGENYMLFPVERL